MDEDDDRPFIEDKYRKLSEALARIPSGWYLFSLGQSSNGKTWTCVIAFEANSKREVTAVGYSAREAVLRAVSGVRKMIDDLLKGAA